MAAIRGNAPSWNARSNWKCTFVTFAWKQICYAASFIISSELYSSRLFNISWNHLWYMCYFFSKLLAQTMLLKKKIFFLFPLSSRRQLLSCATFSTFSPEFATWVSCPARRTQKEELEPEQDWSNHTTIHSVNTYERADCRESFGVEHSKGHDSFQVIPFRMSSAVPYKCPPPSTTSKSMAQARHPQLVPEVKRD